MTLDQLNKIMPYARSRAGIFLAPLNAAMAEFGIDTQARQASFLSQIGQESGQLQFTRELASGAAYDTGALAKRLGNTPEADGDGQRWKGHGLIQITGLANHIACALYFGIPLDRIAAWLETPEGACRSAAWFWKTHGLNELADAGNQVLVTRRVNGGENGLAGRLALFAAAVRALA
ncbi:putative chitinase [Oxalobacteraceae bacterium GrIS 1.11]